MKKLVEIYQELRSISINELDSYCVTSIPRIKNHKLGLSHEEKPIFFIKCNDNSKKSMDINLEHISVQYDLNCQLYDGIETKEGQYTIISLKSDSWSLQEYFIQIVGLMIERLSESVSHDNLKAEISNLVTLFVSLSKPAIKTIQGLWAELLVIDLSLNPSYLISSWHINPKDKYDFNDGISKVEVKSTSKSRRVHSFSIEQLNPNITSELIIASIMTTETGAGTTVFDLAKNIQVRIHDNNLLIRLNQIVAECLGNDLEKAHEIYFDYHLAKDSLKFYNSNDVPRIQLNSIPTNVLNVKFDSDLSNTVYIKKNKSNALLHKALF